MSRYNFRKVVLCHNADVGLRAVIAIHSTALGPATGGLRMWPYASEAEAIMDAMRIGRGMTYKYAAAGVNLGGGKAVIIGDPRAQKTEGRCSTRRRITWSRCPSTAAGRATSAPPPPSASCRR
jgi:leucine dehydrogenase